MVAVAAQGADSSLGDMATGGRYYSEFLLTVMARHAAKYHDDSCSDFLLARARRLLGTAIQQPSSIPTVQASSSSAPGTWPTG